LTKTLARRTFDESGDYAVRAFPIVIREHLLEGNNNGRYTDAEGGDEDKLVVSVEPGKAYVKGYEYELYASEYIDIDKAVDTETRNNQPITTGFGSYVIVDDFIGVFPVNSGDRVSLRNAASNATTPPDGSQIGTARVRAIEYNAAGQYRMYLYDIQMTSSSFESVRSVYYAGAVTSVADIVLDGGNAVLYSSTFSTPIFEAQYKNLSSISSDGYVYRKVITGLTVNNGNATVSGTLGSGESWAFTGSQTAADIAREIIVITQNGFTLDSVAKTAGQILTPTSVTVNSTTSLTIDLGTAATGSGTVTVFVNVRKTTATHNNKVFVPVQYVKFDTEEEAYSSSFNLGLHDVFEVDTVWIADYTEAYPNEATPGTFANWTEVTQKFELNNGQRDGSYELATLTLTDDTLDLTDKRVVVKLSFFNHGTTSGYYTVNSYTANAGFDLVDIPTYESTTGQIFNLRDCIDFRPTVENTSAVSSTISGAEENPASSSTFLAGFTHPTPAEEFIGDFTFYLARIDRVILDTEGVFSVVRGVPSLTPIRPAQPNNAMTLGFVNVAPLPSLSPVVARNLQKPEYACRVTLIDNRRFTMRDIGEINRRIDALEYSTALTLNEQAAANLVITNDAGDNRYKNGILVDSFVGHNVGNVFDPSYNCAISSGQLRPSFKLDNIDFNISSESIDVVRSASDASIVVRQGLGDDEFKVGNSIISSSSATGTVVHVVPVFSNNAYRWVRLYLQNVTGTFTADGTVEVSGGTEGTLTYTGSNLSVEDLANYPVVVQTPVAGSLGTLSYTHEVYAQNPYASKNRNVSSRLLFSHVGEMSLTPASDTWLDTLTPPTVQLNAGGVNDNWEVMQNPWNSIWDVWETVWQGVEQTRKVSNQSISITDVIQTSQQRQEREGCGINATGETARLDYANRSYCRAILPFMRERIVTFSASGLKPNTRVYPFFDNINVSEHCRTQNGSFAGQLVVDASGQISGEFRIPSQTFTVGTKTFTLCDSSTNPTSSNLKTVAVARFSSSGTTSAEENSIISTQTAQITFAQQLETRELVTSRLAGRTRYDNTTALSSIESDPLAQTFFVNESPGGIMLTKFDVYFKAKSNTSPITLQIREVVNGLPSETIVPFSSVILNPRDVNVSINATSPTEFKFTSPVYLKNDTEYCFVLLPAGNDQSYEVWVGELGENEVGTTQRIDKQPFSGMLFVASNNRNWTPLQNEDVKFTMYRAEFDTDTSGTLIMKNAPVDFVQLSDISDTISVGDVIVYTDGSTTDGTGIVKYYDTTNDIASVEVTSGSATDPVGFIVVKDTAVNTTVTASTTSQILAGAASFTGINADDVLITAAGTVIGTVSSVSTNQITLDANSAVTLTAATIFKTKIATVSEIENKLVNAISPTLGYLDFNNTTTQWGYRLYSSAGVDPVTYVDLGIGTTELTEEKSVFSTSNTADTFKLRALLTTEVSNVSPIVDLNKVSCVIVANDIQNSAYITRKAVLDDGQEAEDLRVYVNANLQSGSGITVFAKLLNDTDNTPFDERPWLEMTENSPVSTTGFKEYFFTLPSGNTGTEAGGIDTGDGVYKYTTSTVLYNGFKTFAVKIEFSSPNTAVVPIVRDFRAIALQA
jgi:hypothetical protein